jgi:glycerol-3-phosphate O-acyltransferase
MPETVTLPFWLAVIVFALATWAILARLLTPSVRWFFSRHAQRTLEDFNDRLRIQVRPFKLAQRRTLVDRLMFDEEVLRAADERATELGKPRKLVLSEVEEYAKEIVPAFNAYIYFRLGYWLSRNISRSMYRVRLGSSDVEGLSNIDKRATVIFVMNHRSNMDYILMGHLAAEESTLSYAVGEWARIWPLEQLIRAMGAYFVRRRSRNELYRTVLRRYIQMATAEGSTQAVFPEGRLTRDGLLQAPKLGLFDYMLRDFKPDSDRDVVFVPVAVNYDRVLEDRTLLLNLDPDAKAKRGLAAGATALRFASRQIWLIARQQWHRFGYACVNFGSPVSLKNYLEETGVDFRGLPKEVRFERVGDFANHLMKEIGDLVPVLPVALVSTVVLQQPDRALSELELKADVQSLMDSLQMRGANLYLPRSDREYSIEVGVRMLVLRRVLKNREGLYVLNPEEISIVRYYANSIAHLMPQRERP